MLTLSAATLLALISALVVYHHVGYPLLLKALARRARARGYLASPAPLSVSDELPSVT